MLIAMFITAVAVCATITAGFLTGLRYFPQSLLGRTIGIGPVVVLTAIIEFYVRPKYWPDWGSLIFYSEIIGAIAGTIIVGLLHPLWDRRGR